MDGKGSILTEGKAEECVGKDQRFACELHDAEASCGVKSNG